MHFCFYCDIKEVLQVLSHNPFTQLMVSFFLSLTSLASVHSFDATSFNVIQNVNQTTKICKFLLDSIFVAPFKVFTNRKIFQDAFVVVFNRPPLSGQLCRRSLGEIMMIIMVIKLIIIMVIKSMIIMRRWVRAEVQRGSNFFL